MVRKTDPEVENAAKALCTAGIAPKKLVDPLRLSKILIFMPTFIRIKNPQQKVSKQ